VGKYSIVDFEQYKKQPSFDGCFSLNFDLDQQNGHGISIVGKTKPNVGVGEENTMIGGSTMIKPVVGVMVGVSVGAVVLVAVNTGVGGAAMTASVAGMQVAVTTLPEIQAYPPGPAANWMYHQVPSAFLPATGAVPPVGMYPMIP
jgi:hypothetical protein